MRLSSIKRWIGLGLQALILLVALWLLAFFITLTLAVWVTMGPLYAIALWVVVFLFCAAVNGAFRVLVWLHRNDRQRR